VNNTKYFISCGAAAFSDSKFKASSVGQELLSDSTFIYFYRNFPLYRHRYSLAQRELSSTLINTLPYCYFFGKNRAWSVQKPSHVVQPWLHYNGSVEYFLTMFTLRRNQVKTELITYWYTRKPLRQISIPMRRMLMCNTLLQSNSEHGYECASFIPKVHNSYGLNLQGFLINFYVTFKRKFNNINLTLGYLYNIFIGLQQTVLPFGLLCLKRLSEIAIPEKLIQFILHFNFLPLLMHKLRERRMLSQVQYTNALVLWLTYDYSNIYRLSLPWNYYQILSTDANTKRSLYVQSDYKSYIFLSHKIYLFSKKCNEKLID
jgi:hypothetical protein